MVIALDIMVVYANGGLLGDRAGLKGGFAGMGFGPSIGGMLFFLVSFAVQMR